MPEPVPSEAEGSGLLVILIHAASAANFATRKPLFSSLRNGQRRPEDEMEKRQVIVVRVLSSTKE